MVTNKKGRPFNHNARRLVLDTIRKNPGLNFYKLWKIVEEFGISRGLFCNILKELHENGEILREERERVTKTVTFHLRNLNDPGSKSGTQPCECNSS